MVNWLKRHISNQLFNKLLLLQSGIVILSLGLFIIFTYGRITRLLTDQALLNNRQIVQTVYKQMYEDHQSTKAILKKLYLQENTSESIYTEFQYLMTNKNSDLRYSDEYYAKWNHVENAMNQYTNNQINVLTDTKIGRAHV